MEAAVPYPFTTSGTVGPQNANGYVWVHGFSARETGGTNGVTVTFRENTSSGKIVGEFSLSASAGLGNGILPKFKVNGQVYITVGGSGTVSAVLYVS